MTNVVKILSKRGIPPSEEVTKLVTEYFDKGFRVTQATTAVVAIEVGLLAYVTTIVFSKDSPK